MEVKVCIHSFLFYKNGCLENTDLENADLENTDLENTDLENADLENTDHENADLENTDLANKDLENTDVSQTSACAREPIMAAMKSLSSSFNSFIAKQWMSFCGEGENGVSRR